MLATGQRKTTRTAKRANGRPKFTQRPNWLFRTKFSPTVREVYTVLLSYAWTSKADVFPAIGTIASNAGISPRSVGPALRILERANLIDIEHRWHDSAQTIPTSSMYTIIKLETAQIEAICALSKAEIKALADDSIHPGDPPAVSAVPQNLQYPSRRNCSTPPAESAYEVDELEVDESEADEKGLDGTSAYGDSTHEEKPADFVLKPGSPQSLESVDYNQSLADQKQEHDSQALADHLERQRSSMTSVPMTSAARQQNLKTARLLLACDGHTLAEVTRLLDWAYGDSFWCGRIRSLFALRENYGSVLEESQSRKPRKRRTNIHGQSVAVIEYRPRDNGFGGGLSLALRMRRRGADGDDTGLAEANAQAAEKADRDRAMDDDPDYVRIWLDLANSGEFDIEQPDLIHAEAERRWQSTPNTSTIAETSRERQNRS